MIQEFFKPQTMAEAVELKEKLKDGAVFMAGGTDVNCTASKYEIEKVIGIEQLKLNRISKTDEALSIGAGVTIQELIDSPKIPDQLTIAAGHFVNRNIRNIATVGGNIAITISSKNLAKKYGIRKFSRTANDISIITAAATFSIQHEKLSNVRVAVGGVSRHVVRLTELESKLDGNKLPARTEIEDTVKKTVSPLKDIRGGVQFKKYLAGVLISDCIYNAQTKRKMTIDE
jgi:putative selenate reductase FAD-binding subunit